MHGENVANFILILGIAGAFVTRVLHDAGCCPHLLRRVQGHATPHESPKMMTYPLIGLAFFAVAAGWVNFPGVYTGFTTWLATRVPLTRNG